MKTLLSLSFPLIISQLVAQLLVLTDVWLMSRLSIEELAAGGLGASVYTFIFVIAGSVVGSVANLMAIAYGQKATRVEYGEEQIRRAVKGGVLLSFMFTLLLSGLFPFLPSMLALANQPADIVELAMDYVSTLKWAMLPTLLLLVLRGLTSALGDVRSIMVMSIVTVVLNVPISYILAFTLDLRLAGLGLGTAVAAFVVLGGYATWIFLKPRYRHYSPFNGFHEYQMSLIAPVLKLGVPIALATMLEMGLIYGGTLMAGMISVSALALHQILLQCLSFTYNINFGFSQATAILVGRSFGERDLDGIQALAKRAFITVSLLSLVLSGVFIVWPEIIVAIFELDHAGSGMAELLVSVLVVVALCFVVDAWQLLALNILRGMKIVFAPTGLTAIGYWIFGLPAAWMLKQSWGLAGIWAGIGIGLAVSGVLLLILVVKALTPHRFALRTI
ncbi:MATE family efflux transporter [Thaumasiovibrio sp. DFM-14]|uniref:MATE family efflux transporter n=1 Tax=Thaumasiovibrio sp. DFM-14 TaxID=3384792 RepID=UPI0039A22784